MVQEQLFLYRRCQSSGRVGASRSGARPAGNCRHRPRRSLRRRCNTSLRSRIRRAGHPRCASHHLRRRRGNHPRRGPHRVHAPLSAHLAGATAQSEGLLLRDLGGVAGVFSGDDCDSRRQSAPPADGRASCGVEGGLSRAPLRGHLSALPPPRCAAGGVAPGARRLTGGAAGGGAGGALPRCKSQALTGRLNLYQKQYNARQGGNAFDGERPLCPSRRGGVAPPLRR